MNECFAFGDLLYRKLLATSRRNFPLCVATIFFVDGSVRPFIIQPSLRIIADEAERILEEALATCVQLGLDVKFLICDRLSSNPNVPNLERQDSIHHLMGEAAHLFALNSWFSIAGARTRINRLRTESEAFYNVSVHQSDVLKGFWTRILPPRPGRTDRQRRFQ